MGGYTDNNEEDGGDIHIVVPVGAQALVHSLRSFIQRDWFSIRVDKGCYITPQQPQWEPWGRLGVFRVMTKEGKIGYR